MGSHTKQRTEQGFTLLELLLTVVIATTIALITIPSMSKYRENAHFHQMKRETLNALTSLRVLAIYNNKHTVLCQLDDNQQCNGLGDNMVGFIDTNRNRKVDPNETVQVQLNLSGTTADWRKDGRPIRFNPEGRSLGYNGTLDVCFEEQKGYQIVISNTGRIRLSKDMPLCLNVASK